MALESGISLNELAALLTTKFDTLNGELVKSTDKLETSIAAVQINVQGIEKNLQDQFMECEQRMQGNFQELKESVVTLERKCDENISELQQQMCENTGTIRAELHDQVGQLNRKIEQVLKDLDDSKIECRNNNQYCEERLRKLDGIVQLLVNQNSEIKYTVHECKADCVVQGEKCKQLGVTMKQDISSCESKLLNEIQSVGVNLEKQMSNLRGVTKENFESLKQECKDEVSSLVVEVGDLRRKVSEMELKLFWDKPVQPLTEKSDENKRQQTEVVGNVKVEEKGAYKSLQLMDVKHLQNFSGGVDCQISARSFLDNFESEMELLNVSPNEYLLALKHALINGARTWYHIHAKSFQDYSDFKEKFLLHFDSNNIVASRLTALRTQPYSVNSGLTVTDFCADRYEKILNLCPMENEKLLVAEIVALLPRRFKDVLVGKVFENFHQMLCCVRDIEIYFSQDYNQEFRGGNRRQNQNVNVSVPHEFSRRPPRVNRVQFRQNDNRMRREYHDRQNEVRSSYNSSRNFNGNNETRFNRPPPGYVEGYGRESPRFSNSASQGNVQRSVNNSGNSNQRQSS